MDDPRLRVLLEAKRTNTMSSNQLLAAIDAVDPLRQPVPGDTIPDAAVGAMQKSLRGNGWSVLDGCVDDLRQALAAALPHLAPRSVAAESVPGAWIEGTTADMLRAVIFEGVNDRSWYGRMQEAARRIDERIAAGPVVAPWPVFTKEMAALLERLGLLCADGQRLSKDEARALTEAAFPSPSTRPAPEPPSHRVNSLSRCLSRPPCVTECAEVDRCAHGGGMRTPPGAPA